MALLLKAPAKVNLSLRILGRRADGYHDLETIFHSLDLHDLLYARLAPKGVQLDLRSHAVTGMKVATGEDNLVLCAARKVREVCGSDLGLHFYLEKNIPAGAGLGGGSSDAAAALILANALLGRPLDHPALAELALGLGADVPYFLSAGTQSGKGLGEILSPITNPGQAEFLLIMPPFGCSTQAVYKNHKPNLIPNLPSSTIRSSAVDSPIGRALAGELGNDLESSAMELYPKLAEIRQSVATMGFPNVTMSGSGSTLYLMFCTRARGGEQSILEAGPAFKAMRALEPLGQRGVQLLCTMTASEAVVSRIPTEVSWPLKEDIG